MLVLALLRTEALALWALTAGAADALAAGVADALALGTLTAGVADMSRALGHSAQSANVSPEPDSSKGRKKRCAPRGAKTLPLELKRLRT
jgi:hypothetical protein